MPIDVPRGGWAAAALGAGLLASGCYESHGLSGDGGRDGGRDAAVTDADAGIDAAPEDVYIPVPPPPPPCEAGEVVELDLLTRQSCEIALDPSVMPLGEAYISSGGMPRRILVQQRWGEGHLLSFCDMTSVWELAYRADLPALLGQPGGRVGSMGYDTLCGPWREPPVSSDVPIPDLPIEFLGTPPPESLNDPVRLAERVDVVFLCGRIVFLWLDHWIDTLRRFVTEQGKAILVAMDYVGTGTIDHREDYPFVNELVRPAGVEFVETSIPWSVAEASGTLLCPATD
jgi:hypothetical protein